MEIGKMKLSEVMPHLKLVSDLYGLRLNRAKDFKLARLILMSRYSRES